MGKGRGKGRGDSCCEAVHAMACCLCLVLFGGPILIAVGATILNKAAKDTRNNNIGAINYAVDAWNDPNSPNGWARFSQLTVWAVLTPGDNVPEGSTCPREVVQLRVDTLASDRYSDEGERFQAVKQVRLVTEMGYRRYVLCRYQVLLLQQPPGAAANTTLAALPVPPGSGTLDYSIALDVATGPRSCTSTRDTCYGQNYADCRYNCQFFGGNFDCGGNTFTCSLSDAFFSDVAIKVKARGSAAARTNLSYIPDTAYPDAGGGGNVMPTGYIRRYTPSNGSLTAGPLFQLLNIRPASRGMPSIVTITVRSSADPYLTYLYVTGGSGWLGTPKSTLVASGVVILVVGVIGTLAWFCFGYYSWRMLFAKNRPRERPDGAVEAAAWDMANRFGGQYAPALGVPVGHDGMPTAQPLYVPTSAPVPGQPAYGTPYGGQVPPDPYHQMPGYPAASPHGGGAYPPYGYNPGYPGAGGPPPGSSVEMTQYGSAGATAGAAGAGSSASGYPHGGYPAAPYPPYPGYYGSAGQPQPPPPGSSGGAAGGGGGPDVGATASYAYPSAAAAYPAPGAYPYPYGYPASAAPVPDAGAAAVASVGLPASTGASAGDGGSSSGAFGAGSAAAGPAAVASAPTGAGRNGDEDEDDGAAAAGGGGGRGGRSKRNKGKKGLLDDGPLLAGAEGSSSSGPAAGGGSSSGAAGAKGKGR
ncbi:hypothetical protein HYH02_002564 [Chlamydomonas schloesseri]|uniref:Uncharacterized protein n=1 Tax=Chlamydomonas schloesseri TaxID=2026947 RepID=A0A835WV25_9CHLO|nr:hypothetical protein HYH02_002564 [Chlamydomonas schloesseri]|eukprot:KAG2453241.1 hypothetical protein HYH02_002564 [Chlamydomonas schloesseri]